MGMISTKTREALEKRAEYIEAIEKAFKIADPGIARMEYKVNSNAGKEMVEIKYFGGLIKRIDVTGKGCNQVLHALVKAVSYK